MEKIKITLYEVVNKVLSTPCPNGESFFGVPKYVGSEACQNCDHFQGLDGDYVNCNFKDSE